MHQADKWCLPVGRVWPIDPEGRFYEMTPAGMRRLASFYMKGLHVRVNYPGA